MQAADELTIAFSKRKIFYAMLFCMAYIVLGVYFIEIETESIKNLFSLKNLTVRNAYGFASILIFGGILISIIPKFFDLSPGLILNSSGIQGSTFRFLKDTIPWSDIKVVIVVERSHLKILSFILKNPEKYLSGNHALDKMLHRSSADMLGSHITLSTTFLNISPAELLELLQRYHQQYGTN